ncbi:thioredoxin-like protein [Amylocarpus encephaloides]|uniref:Thioredoxin-like protein n=1 Tax=Amylocarpus encephaloides TaxID=45428 RepID=A0A9P8C177_9HELO|nr:thioredoxin-like protein [Amylocarpus encephaloides]
MYESTINFTFDTICPWTYLAKHRLDKALEQVCTPETSQKVTFTLKYHPYQLYPTFSSEGEPKYDWYKRTKYPTDDQMEKYIKVMTFQGAGEIPFNFREGYIANTLDAHRIIQYFQESKSPEVTNKLVLALYKAYFEEGKHPSSAETLIAACKEAGIDEEEAKRVVEDESEGLMDVKSAIREQASNGVDSVPVVMIEGRRRDVTLTGAKEVGEYVKALEQVVKESQ